MYCFCCLFFFFFVEYTIGVLGHIKDGFEIPACSILWSVGKWQRQSVLPTHICSQLCPWFLHTEKKRRCIQINVIRLGYFIGLANLSQVFIINIRFIPNTFILNTESPNEFSISIGNIKLKEIRFAYYAETDTVSSVEIYNIFPHKENKFFFKHTMNFSKIYDEYISRLLKKIFSVEDNTFFFTIIFFFFSDICVYMI